MRCCAGVSAQSRPPSAAEGPEEEVWACSRLQAGTFLFALHTVSNFQSKMTQFLKGRLSVELLVYETSSFTTQRCMSGAAAQRVSTQAGAEVCAQ